MNSAKRTALLFRLIFKIVVAVLSGLRGYLVFVAAVATIPIVILPIGFLFNRIRAPRAKAPGAAHS